MGSYEIALSLKNILPNTKKLTLVLFWSSCFHLIAFMFMLCASSKWYMYSEMWNHCSQSIISSMVRGFEYFIVLCDFLAGYFNKFMFPWSKNIPTQCKWLVWQCSFGSFRRFWHSSWGRGVSSDVPGVYYYIWLNVNDLTYRFQTEFDSAECICVIQISVWLDHSKLL